MTAAAHPVTSPSPVPLTPAISWPETLTTARLRLRRVVPADLPDLLGVNGDDQVTHFLPYATWHSLADAEAWYQRMHTLTAATGGVQLVLESLDSGRVIGTSLLFRHEALSQRAELGYVLGRAHWGQGWMREALVAVLDQAFGTSGLRRIEAEVDSLNAGSNAVAQRLGFQLEGVLRQRWTGKGRTYDTRLYGLLREEWHGGGT